MENTEEFHDALNASIALGNWDEIKEKIFAERLNSDARVNEDLPVKFDRSKDLDLNFLEATARPNIDYSNLGSYMRYVMEEFDKSYILKKSQKDRLQNEDSSMAFHSEKDK